MSWLIYNDMYRYIHLYNEIYNLYKQTHTHTHTHSCMMCACIKYLRTVCFTSTSDRDQIDQMLWRMGLPPIHHNELRDDTAWGFNRKVPMVPVQKSIKCCANWAWCQTVVILQDVFGANHALPVPSQAAVHWIQLQNSKRHVVTRCHMYVTWTKIQANSQAMV